MSRRFLAIKKISSIQAWYYTRFDLSKSSSSTFTDIQFARNRNTRERNARNVLTRTIDYIETLSPVDYTFSFLFLARIDSLRLLFLSLSFFFQLTISSFRSKKKQSKKDVIGTRQSFIRLAIYSYSLKKTLLIIMSTWINERTNGWREENGAPWMVFFVLWNEF